MNYIDQLFEFLTALKANNNKIWFEDNRKQYQELRGNFTETVKELHPKLVVFDENLASLEPTKCLFRINRDIRFSKDKAPYKTNFSAYFAAGGSQSELAGYYLHIEPSGCFAGGGMYMPQNSALKKIRQEMDYHTAEFLAIINNPSFKSYFGEVQGEKLKKIPADYEKDHALAEFLKLKGFFVTHNLEIDTLQKADFVPYLCQVFRAMHPLNSFLNKAVAD